MLVSIGIVGVLALVGTLGYSKVVDQGKMAQEVGAARVLIAAYGQYPQDNNGRLLPAIDKSAGGKGNPVWYEPEKRNITFAEAPHRYPFRLAPYFDYKLKGVILLNGAEKQIDETFGKSGGMRDYGISMCPAFGLNYQFCGGYVESSGNLSYVSTKEAITMQSKADHPLIVFATAGGSPGDDITLKGYFKIDAPIGSDSPWSGDKWKPGSNAAEFGAVDARYNGRAVCAFLDGSVSLKSIEELRDMRLWSRRAAENNDKSYMPLR
jgi:prepilin-type processing-associated H-X9-DG protein